MVCVQFIFWPPRALLRAEASAPATATAIVSASACGIFGHGFVLGFDTRRKLHAERSCKFHFISVIKWNFLSGGPTM